MVIRAGGQSWIVESRDREERTLGTRQADGFVDLTFRNEQRREDELELGWVPRPERLTTDLARRLFELAGRRRWTDPRSGRRYSVDLVDPGPDEDSSERLRIRFRSERGEARSTIYPLARPLGLATEAELEAMVDVALDRSVGPETLRPAVARAD